MMSIYEKIIEIYPELKTTPWVFTSGIIVLQNDSNGKGDYIAKWNHESLAQPTDNQLF